MSDTGYIYHISCDYCARELSTASKKVQVPQITNANHRLGSWFTQYINELVTFIEEVNDGEYYNLVIFSKRIKHICSTCYFKKPKVLKQKSNKASSQIRADQKRKGLLPNKKNESQHSDMHIDGDSSISENGGVSKETEMEDIGQVNSDQSLEASSHLSRDQQQKAEDVETLKAIDSELDPAGKEFSPKKGEEVVFDSQSDTLSESGREKDAESTKLHRLKQSVVHLFHSSKKGDDSKHTASKEADLDQAEKENGETVVFDSQSDKLEALPESEREKNVQSTKLNQLKQSVFHLFHSSKGGDDSKHLASMDASDNLAKNHQWLMWAQTKNLGIYCKILQLNDVQFDMLLDALSSIASDLSDLEFFCLTKALNTLVSFVSERITGATMPDLSSLPVLPYFLKGLLHCACMHEYLASTFVTNCLRVLFRHDEGTFYDENLAQLAPSFTEAALWCVCRLLSPFTSTRVDLTQLRQILHLIQTFQIPIGHVQDIIHLSTPDIIDSLQIYSARAQRKESQEILKELFQTCFLTDHDDIQEIVQKSLDRISIEVDTHGEVDVNETMDTVKRIRDARKVTAEDIVIVLKNLSCAVEHCMKYKPRLTQLAALCVLLFSHKQRINHLLEVLTGEGKSCIIAMFAAVLGLQGRKADIITSSPLLAERDANNWAPFFEIFKLKTSCNVETRELLLMKPSLADKTRAEIYRSDVVYGTVSSFSADILRDEFEMRAVIRARKSQVAIIDEVDMLMLDEGVQFTYLSHNVAVLRHIQPVLAMVWSAVRQNRKLLTEFGEVLFTGNANRIHKVIFYDMDAEEVSSILIQLVPKLKDSIFLLNFVRQFLAAEDITAKTNVVEGLSTKAMLLLIDLLNANKVVCIKAYIQDENGIARQVSKSVAEYDEDPRQILLIDKGIAVPMFSKAELSDRVEAMVLDHCDLLRNKATLATDDGTVYCIGDTIHCKELASKCFIPLHALVKLGNIQGDKAKAVLQAWNRVEQEKAMKKFNTSDMLSIIRHLNLSGLTCDVVAYTLEEEYRVKHETGQIIKGEGQHSLPQLVVLILDKGKAKLLHTEVHLDPQSPNLEYTDTTNESLFSSGRVQYFDELLSKCLDPISVLVKLGAMPEHTVKQLMTTALKFIDLLNKSGVAHNVTVYSPDQDGHVNKEPGSVYSIEDSVPVLVADTGELKQLDTLEEFNNKQNITFHTEDGNVYQRGVLQTLPEFISNCLDPFQIVHLMKKAGIAGVKVDEVIAAKDDQSRNEAIESFEESDILDILSFLETKLRCKFKAYTMSSPSDNRKINLLTSCNQESQSVQSVLLYDNGKASVLHEVKGEHERDDTMVTPEGTKFRAGPKEYFYFTIFRCVDSAKLLHLTLKRDFPIYALNMTFNYKGSLLTELFQNVEKQDILSNIPNLENYIRFQLTVYNMRGQKVRTSESECNSTRPNLRILLSEKGDIWQLHEEEKIAIPAFLKDYVANQLPTYIESAFTAHTMTENREYCLSKDSKILPVDFQNSGIIETNKRWGGGLQQMLEMKHHLQLSPVSVVTNFLSHIGFFRRYSQQGNLYGISGTIGSNSEVQILRKSSRLYDFEVSRIPACCKSLRYERKEVFLHGDRDEWKMKIYSVLQEVTASLPFMTPCLPGAAALVLCEDISTANEITEFLNSKGEKTISYIRNDSTKDTMFNDGRIITSGDIVIATNLAGRGTDIKVTDEVNQSGGLFCLMTFLPRNQRIEQQAFGRTARQGSPGSVQYILPLSALPLATQYSSIPSMSTVRGMRDRIECHRLKQMVENDVHIVQMREDLFLMHCARLKSLNNHKLTHHQIMLDSMNEKWGQWLQTKQGAIESHVDVQDELQTVSKKWCPQPRNPYQECNYHHLIRLGNACLFNSDLRKFRRGARHYYTMAIEREAKFTMIAYYYRAYYTLTAQRDSYLNKGLADLRRAKELLQVYTKEVMLVQQCATVGCHTVGATDNLMLKQAEVRMQLLHHFETLIDESIHKLEKVDTNDYTISLHLTSVFQFIPKADMMTNEELCELQFLGLEGSYTIDVHKKFKLNIAALCVFGLGLLQVAVGVCITVLSSGALTTVGMGLITEGISDCIDGAWGMATGDFDLKSWAIAKACSITLSIALGGVGEFVAKGAKAAVTAAKAAKGIESVTKAAESLKSTWSIAKGGVKEVAHDVEGIGEVLKNSWGKTLVSNMKATGKLVAKEFISQGAMYALTKLEDEVVQEIFEHIGQEFASLLDLEDFFMSSGSDGLGQIVNTYFVSEDHKKSSTLEEQAVNTFESIAQDVVALLTSSNTSVFGEVATIFRDNILPGISEHVKGKAAVFTDLIEIGFVAESVGTMVAKMKSLTGHFRSEMLRRSKDTFPTETKDNQDIDKLGFVKKMKKELAKNTGTILGEAMTEVLQQNLSWILNQGLRETANKLAAHHINKRLHIEETKEQIGSMAHKKGLLSKPRQKELQDGDIEEMNGYAKEVLNPDNPGNLADLRVAAQAHDCKVVIVDKDLKQDCSFQSTSNSSGKPVITLVHTPPDRKHPKGHYDVLINGNIQPVKAEGSSCMHEAFAEGLQHAKPSEHSDANSVRQKISEEISENPGLWHDHFRRREQLKQAREGHLHLLEGAGEDGPKQRSGGPSPRPKIKKLDDEEEEEPQLQSTSIKEGTFTAWRNPEEPAELWLEYEQENGIMVTGQMTYDGEPSITEEKRTMNGQVMFKVANPLKIVSQELEAENCMLRPGGKRSITEPSFQQLVFTTEDRKSMGKSGPESGHFVASFHGANAGLFFGNSAVVSKWYNQKENRIRKEIRKAVTEHYAGKDAKEMKFNVHVEVEYEDLIPAAGGIKQFIKERNEEIEKVDVRGPKPISTDPDKKAGPNKKSVQKENIEQLEDRFNKVGKLVHGQEITIGEKESGDHIPQASRVKRMIYTVTVPDGKGSVKQLKLFGEDSYDLGRDVELYVHPKLTGDGKGFTNKDLENAERAWKHTHTPQVDEEL